MYMSLTVTVVLSSSWRDQLELVALAWRLDPLDLIAKQPPDGVYVPLQVLDVCQLHAEHAALTQLPPLGLHEHLLQRAHEDVKVEYRVVDQVEAPHLFRHDGEHGLLAVAQALKLQEALVDTLGLIGLLQDSTGDPRHTDAHNHIHIVQPVAPDL